MSWLRRLLTGGFNLPTLRSSAPVSKSTSLFGHLLIVGPTLGEVWKTLLRGLEAETPNEQGFLAFNLPYELHYGELYVLPRSSGVLGVALKLRDGTQRVFEVDLGQTEAPQKFFFTVDHPEAGETFRRAYCLVWWDRPIYAWHNDPVKVIQDGAGVDFLEEVDWDPRRGPSDARAEEGDEDMVQTDPGRPVPETTALVTQGTGLFGHLLIVDGFQDEVWKTTAPLELATLSEDGWIEFELPFRLHYGVLRAFRRADGVIVVEVHLRMKRHKIEIDPTQLLRPQERYDHFRRETVVETGRPVRLPLTVEAPKGRELWVQTYTVLWWTGRLFGPHEPSRVTVTADAMDPELLQHWDPALTPEEQARQRKERDRKFVQRFSFEDDPETHDLLERFRAVEASRRGPGSIKLPPDFRPLSEQETWRLLCAVQIRLGHAGDVKPIEYYHQLLHGRGKHPGTQTPAGYMTDRLRRDLLPEMDIVVMKARHSGE